MSNENTEDENAKVTDFKDDRKRRNADLVKRMKAGEPCSSFNSQLSWFPPRPVIQKDKKLVAILHGEDVNANGDKKPKLRAISSKTGTEDETDE